MPYCPAARLLIFVASTTTTTVAAEPVVTVGPKGSGANFERIQAAIDAAPAGATVRIAAGEYDGDLVIRKALAIEGAGWDRTTIVALQPSAEELNRALAEAEKQLRQALLEKMPAKAEQVQKELAERLHRPAVRVESAQGVRIKGLKIVAQPISQQDGKPRSPEDLVYLTDAKVAIEDCIVAGAPSDGIEIKDGCDVEIRKTLVAGLWGNGIVVGMPLRTERGPVDLKPCKVLVADSDVRNCYHVGVFIAHTSDVTVARSRVSGSAWHGIRYGGGPQQILGCRIFGNARSGIYADGGGADMATIRGNLFARSEGAGIACFSGNAQIVGNTFAENKGPALSVLGPANATAERNLFVSHESGVVFGSISNARAAQGPPPVGRAQLRDNLFWWVKEPVQLSKGDRDNGVAVPPWARLDEAAGNVIADPHFVKGNADAYDLSPQSPARRKGIGAADPLPAESPFPLQPQELAITPTGPERDFQLWKRPALEPLRPVRIAAAPIAAPANKVSYADTFAALYEVLGQEYPCFELKGIDWKAVGAELLPRAREVKDEKEFGLLCMELVARLQDSHALVGPGSARPPTPEYPMWDPGLACVIDDRGRPVVYYVDPGGPADEFGIKPGTTILSIDGKPAEAALAERMKELSRYSGYSSDRYLRYHAAQFLPRIMNRGANVTLEIEDAAGAKRRAELPATLNVRYLPRLPVPIKGIRDAANVSWTMLDDHTGYIYVRRIGNDLIEQLDRAVGDLKKSKGLIIDVRGNSGGGFDAARSFRNFDVNDGNEPLRPRFAGPIAVLIDPRCISAGEGWSSWFVAKKRAKFFGEATAGASSRKRQHALKNGLYTVTFPVKAYTGFLDRPIERRGLEPHEEVRQNARDLAAGRDTVLEAAKEHLAAGQ